MCECGWCWRLEFVDGGVRYNKGGDLLLCGFDLLVLYFVFENEVFLLVLGFGV